MRRVIMFEKVYDKFLKTVEQYDLVSKDTAKIVISTSGGKDANIMTQLLYLYQQRVRPDLELELANAAIPKWKYKPAEYMAQVTVEDEDKKQLLLKEIEYNENHRKYWEAKGIKTVYISHVGQNNDTQILDSSLPCNICFVAQKQALFQYMKDSNESKEVRLAVGITKWDILYLALYHILRCNGKTWKQLKEEDPKKYRLECMHFATFSPYPKLNIGFPGKKIYTIEPIVALSDMETREFSKDLDLPVIPDLCVEMFGPKFSSEKRYFDNFLKVCAREEINLAKNNMNALLTNKLDPLYSDYDDILKLLNTNNVLPPFEDFDGILYDVYMSGLMKEATVD